MIKTIENVRKYTKTRNSCLFKGRYAKIKDTNAFGSEKKAFGKLCVVDRCGMPPCAGILERLGRYGKGSRSEISHGREDLLF